MNTQTAPAIWRITDQRVGAVDALLLGDQPTDSFRISLSIVGNGEDGPEVHALPVYPCRACGWENACAGGEDCHS